MVSSSSNILVPVLVAFLLIDPSVCWLPQKTKIGTKSRIVTTFNRDSLWSPPNQKIVSSSSSSSLRMADEIKEYRNNIRNKIQDQNNQRVIDVVMKFGGSSLANADRVDHVAQLIKQQIKAGYSRPRAVVCSAMGKTTNSLLSAGEFALDGRVNIDAIRTLHTATLEAFDMPETTKDEVNELLDECQSMLNGVRLIQELSPKSLDQLVSYGERCSVRIMAARLNQIGIPAQAFDAWDVGIKTDSTFGDAKILPDSENEIQDCFSKIDPNVVAIVTGFIGHDPNEKITTLGRGGSDLTATQIGASIGLDEIQVWKDVDGILTSDPRVVPRAVPVDQVTYEEAAELAYFGAQVLHPIAMYPAMKHNIPVRVKNSYNPEAVGTIIKKNKNENGLVTAITYKHNVKMLDLHSSSMLGTYGFLSNVFSIFEKHKVSVDVLASSEVSISLTLDKKQQEDQIQCLMEDLKPFAEPTIKEDRAILTLIADVGRSSEVLATVFRVFSTQDIKVEMMSQGASNVNISFILPDDQLEKAILSLHKCFFEDSCIVEPFSVEEEATGEVVIGEEKKEEDSSSNVIQSNGSAP